MKYELEAKYDHAKSFYGKAYYVCTDSFGERFELYSYDTLVAFCGYISPEFLADCGIESDCEEYVCFLTYDWDYSKTTQRHVKEFLRQFGFGEWTTPKIRKRAISVAAHCDYEKMIVRS